jgi:hypothetical protein
MHHGDESMNPIKLLALAVVLLCGSALAAQANIDIQYPVGTSLTTGTTINYGDTDNGDAILLTIRIMNSGSSNLTMGTTPVNGSGYSNVQVNITNTPLPNAVIAAGNFQDITVDIDPDKNSDWKFSITFSSDSPGETTFVVKLKGTEGKPKDEEEDCTTNQGSSPSWLALMGVLSAAVLAVRLRRARA